MGSKTSMSNRRIKVNLLVVAASFLLNTGAYRSLEGLQSSLNDHDGAHALTVLYCTFVVTSFFLPTLAMDFLQSRKAMGTATICYVVYTLANCYPKPFTLIPSAVILGSGASVLWSANRVYISDLATALARQKKEDKAKTTSHFFGIFISIVGLSVVVGSFVSSLVIQSFAIVHSSEESYKNTTSSLSESSTYKTTTMPTEKLTIPLKCGMHNCDASENSSTSMTEETHLTANPVVLYALFGGFAAVQIVAALMLFVLVDDAPKIRVDDAFNDGADIPEKIELRGQEEESQQFAPEGIQNDVRMTRSQRVVKQSLATVKFIVTNASAKMLVPCTIHIGMGHGFVVGQLTKYWVTCVLGIEYVGYALSAFGLGSAIGGYSAGLLTQYVGRWIVMTVAAIGEMIICVYLLIWEPEIDDAIWLFLFIFGALGMLLLIQKTILITAYSLFFLADKEAASAAYSVWDPMGSAIAYAISSYMCNRTFLLLLLIIEGSAVTLYLLTERKYATNQRQRRKVPQ